MRWSARRGGVGFAAHQPAVTIGCGNYGLAKEQLDEVCALADERSAMFWKVGAMLLLGWVSTLEHISAELNLGFSILLG